MRSPHKHFICLLWLNHCSVSTMTITKLYRLSLRVSRTNIKILNSNKSERRKKTLQDVAIYFHFIYLKVLRNKKLSKFNLCFVCFHPNIKLKTLANNVVRFINRARERLAFGTQLKLNAMRWRLLMQRFHKQTNE